MNPKFTLSECSVIALRKARLIVIMRDEAPTHRSVVGFPGQSATDAHQSPESAHMVAGWPSMQKSPDRLLAQDGSPDDAQVAPMVVTPCLQLPHGKPE
jgi:hypothetical protein